MGRLNAIRHLPKQTGPVNDWAGSTTGGAVN